MAETTRHIPVDKDSEVGRLLYAADQAGDPVVIDLDGQSFQLTPKIRMADDLWKGYDPKVVKRALADSAGAFAGMDTDRFKCEVRQQRGPTYGCC